MRKTRPSLAFMGAASLILTVLFFCPSGPAFAQWRNYWGYGAYPAYPSNGYPGYPAYPFYPDSYVDPIAPSAVPRPYGPPLCIWSA